MFRHKFLWLTLIVGLFVFSGCSSSSSDDEVTPTPDPIACDAGYTLDTATNECVADTIIPPTSIVCEDGEHYEDDTNQSCVTDAPTPVVCEDGKHYEDDTNKSCVDDEPVVARTLKSLYVSGIAIDGYIENALIKIMSKTTNSFRDGSWSIELSDLDENYTIPKNSVVTVSGGVDTATGNAFEGILSNIVENDDFTPVTYEEGKTAVEPTKEELNSIVVTPLTTIVTHTVKNNVNLSRDEAQERVAKSLGLSKKMLNSDPIATLNSDDDSAEAKALRLEAAKAIKQSLVIQKLTESLTKSVVTEDDNSVSFEDIFSAVFSTVADRLQEGDGEEVNFEEVLESEADSFAQSVTVNILEAKNRDNNQELSAEENRAEMESFAIMLTKLKTATKVTAKLVTIINKIDIEKLAKPSENGVNPVEVISKTTEVITETFEENIKAIAKAEITISEEILDNLVQVDANGEQIVISDTDVQSDDLDNAKLEAEKVVNAVIAMGGIETVAKKVEIAVVDAIEKQEAQKQEPDFDAETQQVEITFNVNDLNILDENTTNEFSEIFDKYQELGVSINAIIDATLEYNAKVDAGETVESIVNLVITKEFSVNIKFVVDQDKLDSVKTDIETAVTKANDKLDLKDEFIKSLVIVQIVEKASPQISLKSTPKTGDTDVTFTFISKIENERELGKDTVIINSWAIDSVEISETGKILNHKFATAGTYIVSITVTANGKIDTKSVTVVVSAKEVICETGTHEVDGECIDDTEDVTPVISLVSNVSAIISGNSVLFTASSDQTNTVYSWTINGVSQSGSASTFSHTFSTSGTFTVTVTGTVNGMTNTASKTISVLSPFVPGVTSKILILKLNQVTFGKNSYAKTVTAQNGKFATIKYAPLTSTSDSEKEELLSLSFDLEKGDFTNGTVETVTIGVKIENEENAQVIMAVTPDINLTYNNGFAFDTTSATALYGYGVKSNGTPVATEIGFTQDLNLSEYLSIVSNKLTFDYFGLIQKIENKISYTSGLVDSYFTKNGGEYKVSFYISGIDGFNGMKTISSTELNSSFSGDNLNNVNNKFDGTTFGVIGNIKISAIGEISDISAGINSEANATTVDVSNYFSEAYSSAYSLDCVQTDGGITISNDGVITVDTNNILTTECNVTFTGDENTEVSKNFEINVSDVNLDPIFTGAIDNASMTINSAIPNQDISTYFSDPESGDLTYAMNCSITGLSMDSSTGNISGTPTVEANTTCTISAKDSLNQSVTSNEFIVSVSNLPAPTVSMTSSVTTGDTTTSFTFTAAASVSNSATISYVWKIDGTSVGGETSSSFTHIFTSSNVSSEFNVSVVVTANSQIATDTTTVTVSNNTPVISSLTPTTCEVNTTCTFTASASDSDSGDSLTYAWKIGGTLISDENGTTLDRNFTTAGDYNLSVSVSDGIDTVIKDINVSVTEATSFGDTNITLESSDPSAVSNVSISGTNSYSNSDIVVNFTAQTVSTPASEGNVIYIRIDGSDTNSFIITPDDIYNGSTFIIFNKSTNKSTEVVFDKTTGSEISF